MKVRRSRWLLPALVVCGLLPVVVAVVATRWLGPWLVVSEPLGHSDVIFVTDGQTPQRELEGAALFLEGWAPRVAITLPRNTLSDEVRRLADDPLPQERASRVLLRRGVPDAAIVRLGRIVDNTLQELQATSSVRMLFCAPRTATFDRGSTQVVGLWLHVFFTSDPGEGLDLWVNVY